MRNPFRSEKRAVSYQQIWGSGSEVLSQGESKYSPDHALALATVIQCLDLRAGMLGQLPLKSMRSVNGVDMPAAFQPAIITAPSLTVPMAVWTVQMSISRDLWGNAFGFIVGRDAADFPTLVEWVLPDDVVAGQDYTAGPVRYRYRGQSVDSRDVLHIPGKTVLPGSPLGIAPLQRTGLVELSRLAQRFGRDWFVNGAVPSMTVFAKADVTSQQATELSNDITAKWRSRKPAVLGSAFDRVEQTQVAADESQFLQTQRHVQSDICQCFNVRPQWVGVVISGTAVTYQNLQAEKQDKLDSMNVDRRIIEQVLSSQSVTPRGQFVKFNSGAYLQADMAARFAMYETSARIQQMTGLPVLTSEEIRALENLPPIVREFSDGA